MKNFIKKHRSLLLAALFGCYMTIGIHKTCDSLPKRVGHVVHDTNISMLFFHGEIEIGDTLFYLVINDSTIYCHTNNTWIKRTYQNQMGEVRNYIK